MTSLEKDLGADQSHEAVPATTDTSEAPPKIGDAQTSDTQEGEIGEIGTTIRQQLTIEGPEVAQARIELINNAPLFEGLRSPETIAKLLPNLRFFDAQRPGRTLFNAADSPDGLGRENHIVITAAPTTIKVSLPNGHIITDGTEVPAHTTMGERGFLGQARTATVSSLNENGVFWRLDGPIESLDLTEKEQLTLRANLLAARGGEITALNQEISFDSRVEIIGAPELQTIMAGMIGTLGIKEVKEDFIDVKEGHFFYLDSGTLQVVDSQGKALGLVKAPNIVQELIGAGLSTQTARLKRHGIVKGSHVPCRSLIENDHPEGEKMLALAEAAFNLKMNIGNEAVASARPEPTGFDRAVTWAQSLFRKS